MGTLLEPDFTVRIKKRKSTKYLDVSDVLQNIELIDEEKELAYKAEVTLIDVKLPNGDRLSKRVKNRDSLTIYANTGNGKKVVFFGIVWQINNILTEMSEFKLTAYDPLIYLQKSEANLYYKKGKTTKQIMSSVCNKLGLPLSYKYKTATHGKISHRGTYADLIVDTLLEKVRKQTGVKGIFRCNAGKFEVRPEGFNDKVYTIDVTKTGTSVEYSSSMDEMITRVRIINKNKTKATISGDTKTWGVIQKVEDMGEHLSSSKKTARQTIKDYGVPQKRWKVDARDIIYIRKGHKVQIEGAIMSSGLYVVKSVTHNIIEGIMSLEVSKL